MDNPVPPKLILTKEYEDKLLNKLLCRTNSYYNILSIELYFQLFKLYDKINDNLFFSKLSGAMLRLSPKAGKCGVIRKDSWQKDNYTCSEIVIDTSICKLGKTDILISLVHTLCHFQQILNGTEPSTPYHNNDFYIRMKQMGLTTLGIGKDNDNTTGQYVIHNLIDGGNFNIFLQNINDEELFPWKNGVKSDEKDKTSMEKNRNKIAYQCKKCKTKVWGKPGLDINCDKCNKAFKRIDNR